MLLSGEPFDAAYEARFDDAPPGGAYDFCFSDDRGGSRGSTVVVSPSDEPLGQAGSRPETR